MSTMANAMDKIKRDPDGRLPSYAWPGGYPMFYYDRDGDEYCPDCANQDKADPPIVAGDVYWEGPDSICVGCGARIKSAYGDPDNPDGDEG